MEENTIYHKDAFICIKTMVQWLSCHLCLLYLKKFGYTESWEIAMIITDNFPNHNIQKE